MRIPDEDLHRLDGWTLDGLTLAVRNVHRPKERESECRYFELYLKGPDGGTSRDAVIYGLYSSGRPSISLRSYFDISFNYKPQFESRPRVSKTLDLSKNGMDLRIFQSLSDLVDLGGKIIVAVTAPERLELINETFTHLNLDFPPESTYLGALLFRCGCGSFYKSWLFREGGREGPPALQGEKAYSQEDRSRGLRESAVRLMRFLDETAGEPILYRNARARALSILRIIQVDDEALQRSIDEAVKRLSR